MQGLGLCHNFVEEVAQEPTMATTMAYQEPHLIPIQNMLLGEEDTKQAVAPAADQRAPVETTLSSSAA
eukprot:5048642-Amphidinium_carterae.1